MGQYLVRRLLGAIPLLLVITAMVFALMQLAPGGPLAVYGENPYLRAEDLEAIKRSMGLDKPPAVQYLYWLKEVAQLNFGHSLFTGRPVLEMIGERLPATLILMSASMLFSLLIGVILGVISAIRQYSKFDFTVTTMAFVGYSLPPFWFGIVLMIVFASTLQWLPAGGFADYGQEGNPLNVLAHLILPAAMLSILHIATWSRYTRSSMLEVIRQEYIRTARAKGLDEWNVIVRHGLRNGLIPVVTVVALSLPSLFAGAIMTETIFTWPGVGRLFFDALTKSDYPVLMAILTISASLVVIANLLADLVYALLDPRIRLS
jgi:peptide/nickel transport system permease protein